MIWLVLLAVLAKEIKLDVDYALRTISDVNLTAPAFLIDKEPRLQGPTIALKPGEKLGIALNNSLDDALQFTILDPYLSENSWSLEKHSSVQLEVEIPSDHPGGVFLYRSTTRGYSAYQTAAGLVGVLMISADSDTSSLFIVQNFRLDSTSTNGSENCYFPPYSVQQLGLQEAKQPLPSLKESADVMLVNGEDISTSQPTISMSGQIFTIVNAMADRVLEIEVDATCSIMFHGRDNIDLPFPRKESAVIILEGSRARISVNCTDAGVYSLTSNPSQSRSHLFPTSTSRRVDAKLLSLNFSGKSMDAFNGVAAPAPDSLLDMDEEECRTRGLTAGLDWFLMYCTEYKLGIGEDCGPASTSNQCRKNAFLDYTKANGRIGGVTGKVTELKVVGGEEVVPLYVGFGPCQITKSTSSSFASVGDWVDVIPVYQNLTIRCPSRPAKDYLVLSNFLWQTDHGLSGTFSYSEPIDEPGRHDITVSIIVCAILLASLICFCAFSDCVYCKCAIGGFNNGTEKAANEEYDFLS